MRAINIFEEIGVDKQIFEYRIIFEFNTLKDITFQINVDKIRAFRDC